MAGFDNEVVYGSNVDFSGSSTVSGQILTNGQLLIGTTALNAGGTHINVGTLTSPDASVTIGYSSPNITLKAAGGGGIGGTVTQFDVIVGVNATTVGSVGPGTAGQVLQSGGNAANPAYSTSTYPSTNAAGDIIYGTGTNTIGRLALPTIPGSNLSYNGTTVNWFNPLQEMLIKDDFISQSTAGNLNWRVFNSGTSANVNNQGAQSSTHPGTIAMVTGTDTTGNAGMSLFGNSTGLCPLILGAGAVTVIFVIKTPTLSDATNTYLVRVGLMANNTATTVANGVYFEYNDPGGGSPVPNWQIATASASSRTVLDSGIAQTTSYVTLRLDVNAAATSVAYSINGVTASNSPIALTIPTVNIGPNLFILKSAGGTSRELDIDFFYMYQLLTNPR